VAARREWALARCAAARLLLSEPRRAVLDFLCARAAPITVEALVRELVARARCHFVSVYRAVRRFEAAGVLQPAALAGHRAVRLACAGADYLVCEQCGQTAGVSDLAELRSLEARLAARTGYRIQYHWLEFSGLCHRCHRLNQGLSTSTAA
jgi:Fe2+ or Zn2+ uptake regulation protein